MEKYQLDQCCQSGRQRSVYCYNRYPPLTLFTNLLDNLKSAVSDEEKVSSAVESVGNYLAESKVFEDVSLAKEFTEFQRSFKSLLQETNIKKLIVLIDDLDRCLPKVTIETLEAVRLFLFSESTAFVIAADEAMIEYAVRAYFPDFPGENDLAVGYQYSQRYLEKLIQVPFRIPVLGKVESEMYTTLLLIGSSINDGDPNFAKVLEVARTKMKTPWENHGFTIDEIQGAFGDDFSSIAEAFSVANQISDILSKNTQGNPRKIKRFINMLLLRKEIADARGFGAYIQLPIMAKMMLAEQFYPGEYKKIAKLLDEDGKCTQLSEFEETLEANATTQSRETADIPPIAIAVERKPVDTISSHSENPHISEWKSKPDFSSWVLSNPGYLHRATSHYVRNSLGGSKNATLRLGAARSSTARMFSVFNSIIANGISETQKQFNLGDILGKMHPKH